MGFSSVELVDAVVWVRYGGQTGTAGAAGGVEPFDADALTQVQGGGRGAAEGGDGADAFVAGDRVVGAPG